MKNIPNLFTLLNLIFGCIAIVFILQTNETIAPLDRNGVPQNIFLPENIWLGSLFVFGAAVIDFLDGFLARMFKSTSKMGEQLDSLSDMVSFGVAPGMILYQLLRMGFAQQENGLNVWFMLLMPAFIFTSAVAWRLAKFNLSNNQKNVFRGLPSPAAGLLIASFPLIKYYEYFQLQALVTNIWFLYGVILVVSYLMVSNHNFLAIKFNGLSFKKNSLKYVLIILSLTIVIVCMLLNALWFAVPVIFLLYLIVSLFSRKAELADPQTQRKVNAPG